MECGVGIFTKKFLWPRVQRPSSDVCGRLSYESGFGSMAMRARLWLVVDVASGLSGALFGRALRGSRMGTLYPRNMYSLRSTTAAEYERRRENFVKELDFVIADVVMAIVADFMLVWLPAPTVSLQPALSMNAGAIAKFFHNCPDNAFQVALAGRSYTFLQRFGAIMRNGAKLFAVGTSASLIGTGVTNAIIKARKTVNKDDAGEVEDIPIVSTSIAYGVYMAVSSNLRYQVLAGVIEQRMLEPLLHRHKLALSALCFAVRTGNTFLGSLLLAIGRPIVLVPGAAYKDREGEPVMGGAFIVVAAKHANAMTCYEGEPLVLHWVTASNACAWVVSASKGSSVLRDESTRKKYAVGVVV
ncbi:hypothetical protein TRIUR3_07434 [Triticum urartu]|uniref:Uncharacterized protein n=1 Tax=Triticum urartu TaxID=4572 RepID=M8A7Q8_TRIUA|nr:hypothetical protein TRIUR3_07434 [Triticum urartu]